MATIVNSLWSYKVREFITYAKIFICSRGISTTKFEYCEIFVRTLSNLIDTRNTNGLVDGYGLYINLCSKNKCCC